MATGGLGWGRGGSHWEMKNGRDYPCPCSKYIPNLSASTFHWLLSTHIQQTEVNILRASCLHDFQALVYDEKKHEWSIYYSGRIPRVCLISTELHLRPAFIVSCIKGGRGKLDQLKPVLHFLIHINAIWYCLCRVSFHMIKETGSIWSINRKSSYMFPLGCSNED